VYPPAMSRWSARAAGLALAASACTRIVGIPERDVADATDTASDALAGDARGDDTPAAPDAPTTLAQDVAPFSGCARTPSPRAGQEVTVRSATVTNALTAGFHVKSGVLDARGGMVVFGTTPECGRPGNFDAAAVRIGADRALDATFGDGGRLCLNTVVDGENQADSFLAAAVDDEGRLVFVGYSESGRTPAVRGLVARTTADGALDRGFAAQGWRHVYAAPSATQTPHVAFWGVLVDGARILAVGADAPPFRLPTLGVVAAFGDDGELDPGFARQGLLFDPARHFFSAARRSDGYIVSGTERTVARVSLRALDRDGAPLRSFGEGGVAIHAHPRDSYAGDPLVDDDGGVLVVRAVMTPGDRSLLATADVVRFHSDGRTDETFGVDGAYATASVWAYNYSHGRHLTRHCNGRVVFSGQTGGESFGVHRFDARGRPDPSFGSNGVATLRGSGRPGVIVGTATIAVDPTTAEVLVAGGNNANDSVYLRAASY
jgi:uncharacterized delta-60 repeat protein